MQVVISELNLKEFIDWITKKGARGIITNDIGNYNNIKSYSVTFDISPLKRGRKTLLNYEKIKELRAKGKSLAVIAEIMGCSKTQVQKIIKLSETKKGTLSVTIPNNKKELELTIKNLKLQIEQDNTLKDRHIHQSTLNELEKVYLQKYSK